MPGASNNTQPAQGGIEGLLAKAPDPLGLSNGGGGLDPLNLMGHPAAPPGVPTTLTNSAGPGGTAINPRFFNPNSFGGNANLGSGPYNAMASKMAGPQYRPVLMPQPKTPSAPAAPGMPSSGGGQSVFEKLKGLLGPNPYSSGAQGNPLNPVGSDSLVSLIGKLF